MHNYLLTKYWPTLIFSNKLLEIADLRNMLAEAECNHKTCEERLTILKTQVCQLQKQLFEFNSAKSNVIDLQYY